MKIKYLVILLVCLHLASCSKSETIGSPRPSVIVLLLDTTRADHLGAYGYERDTSPNLDAFAAENIKFNYAVPSAPWTPPSVLSILSGSYVVTHALMPPAGREDARKASSKVDSRLDLLSEILQRNGYSTAAISSNPWVSQEFGYEQGFDTFKMILRASAEAINEEAFKIFKDFKGKGKPTFVYLHYLDPHWPYVPPDDYKNFFPEELKSRVYNKKMSYRMRLYDQEIRYLDTQIGKLFEFLKKEELYKDSIIVIVGDHGEQFLEHRFVGHGKQIFNTEAHVPLLIKLAGDREMKEVVDHTVSTIDIFATILEELKIEIPKQAALSVHLLNEKKQKQRAGVMCEISNKLFNQRSIVSYEGKKLIIGGNKKGQRFPTDDPTKYIVGVFDARKDYFETTKIEDESLLAELQAEYRNLYQAALALKLSDVEGVTDISPETLENLKSLGYLD